jgi:hypothetical protein
MVDVVICCVVVTGSIDDSTLEGTVPTVVELIGSGVGGMDGSVVVELIGSGVGGMDGSEVVASLVSTAVLARVGSVKTDVTTVPGGTSSVGDSTAVTGQMVVETAIVSVVRMGPPGQGRSGSHDMIVLIEVVKIVEVVSDSTSSVLLDIGPGGVRAERLREV